MKESSNRGRIQRAGGRCESVPKLDELPLELKGERREAN